jgi:hypothetical protein
VQTLYELINPFNNNICGIYVDHATLADGLEHIITFDLNIPIIDLMPFQAFGK